MTLRQANFIKTGRKMDRQAPQAMDDDDLIDELVELMLSPRSKGLVPKIIERLNASKEGRKISVAKRSAKAIRMLQDEIRQVMTEIRRRREQSAPDLRFMELKRKFLDARVIVEEIGLLHADMDDRHATSAAAWRDMAKRIEEHGEVAQRIARKILRSIDVVDVEWVEETEWEVQSLLPSIEDDEIAEAEVVE